MIVLLICGFMLFIFVIFMVWDLDDIQLPFKVMFTIILLLMLLSSMYDTTDTYRNGVVISPDDEYRYGDIILPTDSILLMHNGELYHFDAVEIIK